MTRKQLRVALEHIPVERRLAVIFALTGLKQQDVALRAGMTEPLFSRTVAGRRTPSTTERQAIAQAIGFGLSVADVFGEEVAA